MLPLLLLALGLRLMVPQGWMPSPGGGIMPCPAQMVMPAAMPAHHHHHAGMKMPTMPDAPAPHHTLPDCPFAALGAPAAPPAPVALLLPVLVVWQPAPMVRLPLRMAPALPRFLRPPAQGPPLAVFA